MVFFLGKETQCGIEWKDIFLCKFSFSIYEFFFPRINGSNHSQTKKIVLELVFGSVIEIETNQTKKILDILEFKKKSTIISTIFAVMTFQYKVVDKPLFYFSFDHLMTKDRHRKKFH